MKALDADDCSVSLVQISKSRRGMCVTPIKSSRFFGSVQMQDLMDNLLAFYDQERNISFDLEAAMLEIVRSQEEAVHFFANEGDLSTIVLPDRGTFTCNILLTSGNHSLGRLIMIQRLVQTCIEISGPKKPREPVLIGFSFKLSICTGSGLYYR